MAPTQSWETQEKLPGGRERHVDSTGNEKFCFRSS